MADLTVTRSERLSDKRRGRDIWISRQHIYAAGIGATVLVVMAFVAGVRLGRSDAMAEAEAGAPPVGDGALIELLARVEATSDPNGGVQRLTFPESLATSGTAQVPVAAVEEVGQVAVDGGPVVALDRVDPRPAGTHTLRVAEFSSIEAAREAKLDAATKGAPAWVSGALVDGTPRYALNVGGYGSESEARVDLPNVAATLGIDPSLLSVGQ